MYARLGRSVAFATLPHVRVELVRRLLPTSISAKIGTRSPIRLEGLRVGYNTGMGIGASIFLIVVGAILTFAVDATVAGLDLDVVGWILMLAGVAGLVLFLYFWNRQRSSRAVTTERRTYDDTGLPPA